MRVLRCGTSAWLMTAWGQLHALPRRSIAVRFTPVSGIDSRSQALPGCAISQHMRCSNWAYYGLMPASWITLAHFGMSALIRALNSSGGTAEGSKPISLIFSLTSGVAIARAISRYNRSMISRGVPAGAQTHCGDSCTCPDTPTSSIVGTSGRSAIRFPLVTARVRRRPSLICADAAVSGANPTRVCPRPAIAPLARRPRTAPSRFRG
jgi:hypothetical protein